jgi:hypothetical protein
MEVRTRLWRINRLPARIFHLRFYHHHSDTLAMFPATFPAHSQRVQWVTSTADSVQKIVGPWPPHGGADTVFWFEQYVFICSVSTPLTCPALFHPIRFR